MINNGFSVSSVRIQEPTKSLKDIHLQYPEIDGTFNCNGVESDILGLLLIKGLTRVNLEYVGTSYDGKVVIFNFGVQSIISKYFPNTEGRKGLLKCKAELIDAGYEEYARI